MGEGKEREKHNQIIISKKSEDIDNLCSPACAGRAWEFSVAEMEPGNGGTGCFIACSWALFMGKLRGCLSRQDGRCPDPTKNCLNLDPDGLLCETQKTWQVLVKFAKQKIMKRDDPPEASKKQKSCLL